MNTLFSLVMVQVVRSIFSWMTWELTYESKVLWDSHGGPTFRVISTWRTAWKPFLLCAKIKSWL